MFTIFKHTLAVFTVIAVAAAPSAAYAGVELNPSAPSVQAARPRL